MSGNIDYTIVHTEQIVLQGQLNALEKSDPEAYTRAISEINSSMNGLVKGKIGVLLDEDMNSVVQGYRKQHGNIDFRSVQQREALGRALMDHLRQKKRNNLILGGRPVEFSHC